MKFINKYKSPNSDKRNNGAVIDYIIIHYTAMHSDVEAIKHLCNKNNKVSSHFLLGKSGKIFNLVDLRLRAWHAGISKWKKLRDINSVSIGIEIDNSGHHNSFENYTTKQTQSLIKLLRYLKKKYCIKSSNILGHSDIAPYRKIDPGEKFPWNYLAMKKIVQLPNILDRKTLSKIENLNKINSIATKKNKIIFILSLIGFNTVPAKKNHKKFILLLKAYQMHFRPSCTNGVIDKETYNLILSHFKQSLTI